MEEHVEGMEKHVVGSGMEEYVVGSWTIAVDWVSDVAGSITPLHCLPNLVNLFR
jgi:hypothetical protein